MFTKISIKKLFVFVLLIFIWLLLFFYLNLPQKEPIVIDSQVNIHNWIDISKILTEDNYKKIGINPDKYNTFEAFLQDFKTFTWVLVDPITEKFVIWLNINSKDLLFIPFDFKNYKYNFDDITNKNLAILDIYKAYKDWKIYWWIDSKYWNKILFENDFVHPATDELNKIFTVNVFDENNNVYDKIKLLEVSDNIWISNMELLAYLYDLTWEYNKWIETRKNICKKYNQKCDTDIDVKIYWNVVWQDWIPIKWVKIELLNNNTINTKTDNEWNFTLNFKNSSFSHLRLKSSLEWFSDWFSTISLNNTFSKNIDFEIKFDLFKSNNYFSINKNNKSKFIKWKYYIIESDNSKYFIPIKWLYYQDWTNFVWDNINVYTYLFKKSSNMDSLLENDTFEPVYWYVGNIMKTFGMPYIQFIDKDSWRELFVKSSDPMILQDQVYHMKELYENYDKIYEELTKEDMEFLVKKSEELWWYPIDFEFIIQNEILRWPARWSLDRITGIWHNVWVKVISVDWLVELPFYHIDDKQ